MSPDVPQTLRGLPRETYVLVVVVALGLGVVEPAIPLFARHLGVGSTAAAPWPSRADALRRRRQGAGQPVDAASSAVALLVSAGVVGAAGLLGLTVPTTPPADGHGPAAR